MAFETAGRGTLVILAALLCLDFQSDARQLELNVEVGAVFSGGESEAFLARC